MAFLFDYLLIVNAAAFLLMLADKYRAKKNLWRIPEKTLFASALLGGSLGAIAGMYTARHKTKHLSVIIGIPMILAAQLMALIWFLSK